MNTFIYKSSRKAELYLYITQKDDFSDVPQSLLDAVGNAPIFVMEITLSEDKQLAREDVKKVMQNLQTQGFHVQAPPAALNLTTFKAKPTYVN